MYGQYARALVTKRRSGLGDQRLDHGNLLVQGGAIGAAQGSVADLAAGLEGLAVVVQTAIVDGDNLLHRRNHTDKVEYRALTYLGSRAQRQAGDGAQVVLNWLHSAPSMVQCPELCTRGAISLAFRPPSTSKNSKASTPT